MFPFSMFRLGVFRHVVFGLSVFRRSVVYGALDQVYPGTHGRGKSSRLDPDSIHRRSVENCLQKPPDERSTLRIDAHALIAACASMA